MPAGARDVGRETPLRRMIRIALVLLAAAGAIVCLLLSQMSLPASSSEGSISSVLCAPSEHVNCDYVLSSRWARVGPISAAQLGLVYFCCLGLWFGVVGLPNRAGMRWHLAPTVVASLGLCGSIAFVMVMAFQLPVWCPWCLAAHAINAVLFLLTLLSWLGMKTASAGAAARPTKGRALGTIGVCFGASLLLLLSGIALYHQANSRRFQLAWLDAVNTVDYIVWRHETAPFHEIPVRTDDLILGDPAAPKTLVVFSDFECPGCAELHANVGEIVRRFPQIRCVFKHYPVCRACNEHVRQTVHHFACEAARAAEAYRIVEPDAKNGLRYCTRLFEARSGFDERPYLGLTGLTGEKAAAFERAMSGDAVKSRIEEDIALAHRLGVVGTPSVFLDGRRLERWSITTNDASPRRDGAGTLRLWERLAGPATSKPAEESASP